MELQPEQGAIRSLTVLEKLAKAHFVTTGATIGPVDGPEIFRSEKGETRVIYDPKKDILLRAYGILNKKTEEVLQVHYVDLEDLGLGSVKKE